MIHVVAEITLKPGCREEFVKLFKAHVLKVRRESGCAAYAPVVDAPGAPMAGHPPRENVMTVIEQWESLEALAAHLQAPHQTEFFKKTGAMRVGARVEVMQDA